MKVGLSLGGGGSRGYAHMGVIRALTDAGIPIDMINGTSAGAVMGGGYALYRDVDTMAVRIKDIVQGVKLHYFNIFRHSSEGRSFMRNWLAEAVCDVASLHTSVQSHRHNLKALRMLFGDSAFADTKIPFSCAAFDLTSRKTVVIKRGKLVDGILPSVTLPGVFPPVRRGKQLLIDGYVLANIPVRELRAEGADFVISVELGATEKEPYRNGLDLLTYMEGMKQRRLERWEIEQSDFHIRINFAHYDGTRFDNYAVGMELGYNVASRMLPKLKRRLEERAR